MDRMRVIDIIGTKVAISPRMGLVAYNYIADEVRKNHAVLVSFEGIQDLTSAFCNAFIGKLYMDFGKGLQQTLLINDVDSEIWNNKIQSSIMLGSNEHERNLHNSSLGDIFTE